MILEISIGIAIGILAGTITGLTPGLHINLVNVGILLIAPLIPLSPFYLCVFIIAMSVTHTFTDALPSVYLGAPDSDHTLSALPGHKLLLEGKGHAAIACTVIGGLTALTASMILFPLLTYAIIILAPYATIAVSYIIITVILYLLSREKNWEKRGIAVCCFLLSGMLGSITFSLPLTQPLFPLLSGLFGLSILLPSLTSVAGIPQQHEGTTDTTMRQEAGTGLLAAAMGFFAAFLPGFGASQSAIIGLQMMRKRTPEGFLLLTGGINTGSMVLSLATALAIGKARNGSIVSVVTLIGEITATYAATFLMTGAIAGGIAAMIALYLSRRAAKLLPRLPYRTLMTTIIVAIMVVAFLLDGLGGFILLLVATAIGLFAHLSKCPKHYLLGCLLLPVIIYFL